MNTTRCRHAVLQAFGPLAFRCELCGDVVKDGQKIGETGMAINLMEKLWAANYIPGETCSYHGDMAKAFERMLAEPLCDSVIAQSLKIAIYVHCRLERMERHVGPRWFCAVFGSAEEKAVAQ